MGSFVEPKVYLTGYTVANFDGIKEYLIDTKQAKFLESLAQAAREGISTGEALCSMYAKLCYKSLAPGHNANITRTRDVADNLRSCFDVGHGSVFEHCQLNFIISNCSRVLTHELVRHRVGTAFSQESGRYCRLDKIDFVLDPLLAPIADVIAVHLSQVEDLVYLMECSLGLRAPPGGDMTIPANKHLILRDQARREKSAGRLQAADELRWVPSDKLDFSTKKKITSAIRRIAPNGQANEIGFSANIRAIRHIVQMRTNRAAEREIRFVFGQVYRMLSEKFPLLFYGATVQDVDGLAEVTGMKLQP